MKKKERITFIIAVLLLSLAASIGRPAGLSVGPETPVRADTPTGGAGTGNTAATPSAITYTDGYTHTHGDAHSDGDPYAHRAGNAYSRLGSDTHSYARCTG